MKRQEQKLFLKMRKKANDFDNKIKNQSKNALNYFFSFLHFIEAKKK